MKSISKLAGLMAALIIVASGCASNEIVRKEEPVVLSEQKIKADTPVAATPLKSSHNSKVDLAVIQSAAIKESTAEAIQPIPNAAELKAALETIYFNYDAYTLSNEARNALVKNSNILKNDSSMKIRIEGHCDERGSEEYNLALGENRAKAAMKYLVTMGIADDRISTISYGKEMPAVQGHDETTWAKNRRDEFVITSVKK